MASAASINNPMLYCLANNVQVRKEGWGLLFYSQTQHRIFFLRSKNLLFPDYFEGAWTLNNLLEAVVTRTQSNVNAIEPILQKLLDSLLKSGMIVHELL
jgi:putative mycofactocin binding protein MftB